MSGQEWTAALAAGITVALLCAFVVWYVRHNPPKD